MHQCADLLTTDGPGDVSTGVEVEEDHGQVVVTSQADGRRVGNLEVPGQVVVVAELVELDGSRVNGGVRVVDTVDAVLAHQQHFAADLEGALGAKSEAFADNRTHRAAHEGEIERAGDQRALLERAFHRDQRVALAAGFLRGLDPVRYALRLSEWFLVRFIIAGGQVCAALAFANFGGEPSYPGICFGTCLNGLVRIWYAV